MRQRTTQRHILAGAAMGLCLLLAPISSTAGPRLQQENLDKRDDPPPQYKQAVDTFEEAAKDYVKLRAQLEKKLPSLPEEATPEQITAHEEALKKLMGQARTGAKPGDIFNPQISEYIRTLIRAEFKGEDRRELRKTALEADTKGVPLRVNQPYPETKEFTEMPPTLLLELPLLPKDVRYRFVGRHMALIDAKNNVIIDYMTNALP
jgi:hypothetical protein